MSAPSGLPLVQHALLMGFELIRRKELDLATLVRKVCHAPAELFGVRERGYIREGYWADLVLVDETATTRVRNEDVLYKVGWTPLDGMVLPGHIEATWVNVDSAGESERIQRVAATFVNGELAWDGKQVFAPCGERMRFAPVA